MQRAECENMINFLLLLYEMGMRCIVWNSTVKIGVSSRKDGGFSWKSLFGNSLVKL